MTSRDFVYWMQGFLEVSQAKEITSEQTTVIRNHLNMVFKHEIDPSHGDADHQKTLSEAHQGLSGVVGPGAPSVPGGVTGIAPTFMGGGQTGIPGITGMAYNC